jgi:hypothetical protein
MLPSPLLFKSFSAIFPQTNRGSPSVLLTLLPTHRDTKDKMARYSAFLGRRVQVQYRAGDILLPASGTFVADSGRSIFLEQNFEQRGQHKHFRWEIPYQCLVRIEEKPDSDATVNASPVAPKRAGVPQVPAAAAVGSREEPRSAAAAAAAGAPGIVPLSHSAKTA